MKTVKIQMLVTHITRVTMEREVPDDWTSKVFDDPRNKWVEALKDDAISQANDEGPDNTEAECEGVR